MRAFVVIRKIPPVSSGGPQVVGVVLVRGDGVDSRFQPGIDEEPILRFVGEADLHSPGQTRYPLEDAQGIWSCWEIPVEPGVDIATLFDRWVGPSHFF